MQIYQCGNAHLTRERNSRGGSIACSRCRWWVVCLYQCGVITWWTSSTYQWTSALRVAAKIRKCREGSESMPAEPHRCPCPFPCCSLSSDANPGWLTTDSFVAHIHSIHLSQSGTILPAVASSLFKTCARCGLVIPRAEGEAQFRQQLSVVLRREVGQRLLAASPLKSRTWRGKGAVNAR